MGGEIAVADETIRTGVIGYGYWGPNLVRNLTQIQGATVSAVCDLRQDRLEAVQSTYPYVAVTPNPTDLLDSPDVDAVLIATPVSTHHALAREALLRDKDVLVEKPFTSSSEKAQELIELAERRGRVLMVGHTFEYHPAVVKVKELVTSGEIGQVYYVDSSRVNLGLHQADSNVVWDLTPHDLSIILYWLEMEPIRVSARGMAYIQDGIEDVAFITLEFPGKVLAHIHVSWLAPSKLRRTTVIGSKKMIVYDDLASIERIKVYDRGVAALENSDSLREFQRTYRIGDIHSPHVDISEPLRIECEHFLECVRRRARPRTDGYGGLRVVRVVEAAERSLCSGGMPQEL